MHARAVARRPPQTPLAFMRPGQRHAGMVAWWHLHGHLVIVADDRLLWVQVQL